MNSYSVLASHSMSNYCRSNHLRKTYQHTKRSLAYSFDFENKHTSSLSYLLTHTYFSFIFKFRKLKLSA